MAVWCLAAQVKPEQPVSLTSVPDKIRKKTTLEFQEKLLKISAVADHSQLRFTRRKSCFMNSTLFCDKVRHLVDQDKGVDEIILDFSKAFNSISHSILPDKMSSTARKKHNVMGEQLAGGSGSKGCGK